MWMPDLPSLPRVALSDRLKVGECSVVYFILDAEGQPLYIGATAHLRTRLGCHRIVRESPGNGAVQVAWMICDWRLGLKIESDLIFALKPPLNVRGKARKIIPNIPPNWGGMWDSPEWVWRALGIEQPGPIEYPQRGEHGPGRRCAER